MSYVKSVEAAAREAAEAVGAISARREFTISKFGRHENGYLHARCVTMGRSWYVTNRYGSWLLPGHIHGRAVLKEPEAVWGNVLGREIKYALAAKARRWRNSVTKPDTAMDDSSSSSGDPA